MTNKALVTGLDKLVQESVVVAQHKLVEFAADRGVFETALIGALGSSFRPQLADQLRQSLIDGSFEWPQVEVRSAAELQGALGAYATQSRTIYLSASFLADNITTPDNIAAVLLEEFGHDFDVRLNPGHDAPGDEGAIFSALVRGQNLSEDQLQQLRLEDDRAIISIDGMPTSVEMATFSTGSTGSNQPVNNLQPYATHNYIIAIQGLFPSRNLSSEPFIGAVEEFAGNFAPRGWALCQGQLLPIAQNQALFAILGTTYGGNGTTTFALPDLRGRIPVGVGNNITLGQQIGTETVTLTTGNLPAHNHTTSIAGVPTTDSTGSGQPFSNWQPSLGLTPVIALQGVFPSRNLGTDEILGGVSWFAGNFAPRGYAVADGSLLSIAQNTALFSILGTTYGGNGTTTFALPDLRGRTPVHAGAGSGLSAIQLGERGGTDTVTLTTANLPNHFHTISGQANSGATGGGQPFDNRQPYLGLNYVVALEGIYPSQPLDAGSDPTDFGGVTPDVSGLVNGQEILSEEVALRKIDDLSRVAISLWAAAGISEAQIATLETAKYKIANLAPGSLAFVGEDNVVTIDSDASNRGWFVDETPEDSVEYGTTDPITGELYATDPNASGHFDLLTAILHEQGHILGFAHTSEPGKLMYGSLGISGRLFPTLTDMVEFSPTDTESPFLSGGLEYIGGVSMFAGNFAPRGFAFADGQLLPIALNDALFSLIGTTYGGDGQTTFALPDFRGRTSMGIGQGPGLSSYILGQAGGSQTTTLTVNQMSAHSHTFTVNNPPTAGNDSLTATQGVLLTIPVATLLGNDSDPDQGDILRITGVSNPVKGIVTLNDNATPANFADDFITFNPTGNGAGGFNYTLSDGNGGNTQGTVSLLINGPDGPDLLIGTDAPDYLNGGNGNDTILGGLGSDTLEGGNDNDILVGEAGNDTLVGGEGNDTLQGGTGNDSLSGGAGNDILDALDADADMLVGGSGDDIYVVNSSSDTITENLGEGTDTVIALGNFTLSNNIENLYLYDAAVSGTGNSLDNFIVASNSGAALSLSGLGGNDFLFGGTASDILNGGVGNDFLSGNLGDDQLIGGVGDDLYVVDSSSDTIVENLGEGTDTVIATVNFTLSDNVENLFLYNGATVGTGNASVNIVTGNVLVASLLNGAGGSDFLYGGDDNDTLIGGEGNDIITGAGGNDQFVFGGSGVDFSNIGVDTIVDFSSGDQIILSLATFALSGTPGNPLSMGDFATVATDLEAQNSTALIAYNSSTGSLFYNQDRNSGSGFGTGGQFATLLRAPALTPISFLINS